VSTYWCSSALNNRAPPTEDNPEAEEAAELDQDAKELEATDKDFGEKKTDKTIDKVDEKRDVKRDENVSTSKPIDISVGVKVKQPKPKEEANAKPESEGAAKQVFQLGEMDAREDGGLYPVGKYHFSSLPYHKPRLTSTTDTDTNIKDWIYEMRFQNQLLRLIWAAIPVCISKFCFRYDTHCTFFQRVQ